MTTKDREKGDPIRPALVELPADPDSLVTINDLCSILRVGRNAIYDMIDDNAAEVRFPEPFYLRPRQPRWRAATIRHYLALKLQETQAPPPPGPASGAHSASRS